VRPDITKDGSELGGYRVDLSRKFANLKAPFTLLILGAVVQSGCQDLPPIAQGSAVADQVLGFRRGRIWPRKKQPREPGLLVDAVESYDYAISAAPMLRTLGRFDEALICLDEALRLSSDDEDKAVALAEKGAALFQMGRTGDAECCFDQVLRIDPKNAGVWHLMGVVYAHMGRLSDALSCSRRANGNGTPLT
jgi:tetratricopeptide (TPR) repeat protein